MGYRSRANFSDVLVIMIPAFLVIVTGLTGTSFALESLSPAEDKRPVTTIEKELNREKELFHKYGAKEKSLLAQLSDLEKEIAEHRCFLSDISGRISRTKKELGAQEGILREVKQALGEAEERLARRLVAFYKYAKRGYIQILANATGLHDLRRRIKYLKGITRGDQELLDKMFRVHQRHEQELVQTKEKLDMVNRLESEEKECLATLKKDLDKKVLLLMKVHKEKEFYETAVKELELAAQNLGNTLINLEKRPDSNKKNRRLPSGFKNTKGQLPLPFPGRIIRGYKPLNAKGLKTHKGIYIEGPAGGEVKSVYAGRVEYSGWLKGYGQIIVINHGSRYFTVSAHLLNRNKEEGDMVREGEIIGLLGDSESLAGPRLYFEIRNGGRNLDPLMWLKAH